MWGLSSERLCADKSRRLCAVGWQCLALLCWCLFAASGTLGGWPHMDPFLPISTMGRRMRSPCATACVRAGRCGFMPLIGHCFFFPIGFAALAKVPWRMDWLGYVDSYFA